MKGFSGFGGRGSTERPDGLLPVCCFFGVERELVEKGLLDRRTVVRFDKA